MTEMRNRRLHLALVFVLAGTSCGDNKSASTVPDSWTLAGRAVTLKVERSPFAYSVTDGSGKVVLSTSTNDGVAGYGPLGWTTGTATLASTITPGYFGITTMLDPWRDAWQVSSATQTSNALALLLTKSGSSDGMTVTFTAGDTSLRVEAQMTTIGQADRSAQAATTPTAWEAAFATPSTNEGFLGLGERFTRTNFRGLAMYSFAEEGGIGSGENQPAGPHNPYPNGEAMTYYPIPFFMSTNGYGFWLDTTYWNEYDFAIDEPDTWRIWTIAPTLAFEIYVPDPADSRAWTYQIIDQFTNRTGRPMIPPQWTLGPRRRIGRDQMQNGEFEIQEMRDLDLSLTVMDDTEHYQPSGVAATDEPGILQWNTYAKTIGIRTCAYYNPFFNIDPTSVIYPLTQTGVADNYFLEDATGTPSEVFLLTGSDLVNLYAVDFTSAAATAWFQPRFDQAINDGYTGWMYDFGEYTQPDVVASSGMTGYELHNLYPVIYHKAGFDYMQASSLKDDWLTYVRSGYTGAAQYSPLVWSGDPAASFDPTNGLPSMVRAAINIGLSGVPNWGGDIGGYKCIADGAQAADGELLTRWIEMGSTTPDMHDENACVGGDESMKATIWTSTDAQTAWKTYAKLHTRLEPYFYSLACAATQTGAPIIRHMFLENPDHPEWAGVDDVYYIGPSILAAPVVVRNDRTKTFDLPDGHWLDWQAQTVIEGGQEVTLDAPLDKLPLLLRDGSLIPMFDPTIETLQDADPPNPAVIGPSAVAGVLDVVGFLSAGMNASFTTCQGQTFTAAYAGQFAPPSLPLAASASGLDLSTCTGCYLTTPLAGGLTRVQISVAADAPATSAGGLTVGASPGLRVRYDLFLLDPQS